jgi:hypothetical protein
MLPPLHPCCEVWDLDDELVVKLAASIAANGQQHPVTLTADGRLLDGRHRWLGCEKAGVEPKTQIYDGDDPAGYVAMRNTERRHLPKHKLVAVVHKLVTMQKGGDRRSGDFKSFANDLKKQTDIAKQFDVSVESLTHRRNIERFGEPNVVEFVDTGIIGVQSAGHYVRNTPREEQRAATAAEIKHKGSLLRKGKKASAKAPEYQVPERVRNINPFKLDTDTGDIALLNPEQRVHLHPPNVATLLQDRMNATSASMKVLGLTGDAVAPAFLEETFNRMLAYQPVKGKRNGEEINFADDAQKAITRIKSNIDAAMERLAELRALMAKY